MFSSVLVDAPGLLYTSPPPDKRELLEIAKANAARVLGTNNIVLPASLRLNTASKETNSGNLKSEDAAESTEVSMTWSVSYFKGKLLPFSFPKTPWRQACMMNCFNFFYFFCS